MKPDDTVCYCFHVTRRKLETFARLHQPRVVSQMSGCGGAGTGCGWCIPFLRQIFLKTGGDIDEVTPEEYEHRRTEYIREGKGTPPSDT